MPCDNGWDMSLQGMVIIDTVVWLVGVRALS
jgi:hypothetical protein